MNRILDPRGEQERPVIKLAQRPSICLLYTSISEKYTTKVMVHK